MGSRKYGIIAAFLLLLWPIESWAQAGLAEMNTWIEGKLAVDNSFWAAYFFLFLGGILASLLPCVYPLYPITTHVIKARGDTSARWVHPLTYFLGLASMYLVFGAIASVSGGAFNVLMQYPLTNLSIGLLIIIMGMASAGLLHIPLFGGQADTHKKGLPGTFVLGMGAGLLASSCVGPVVVSILIGLASSVGETFSPFVALISSLKMLAFGLGLGIPFLLIGVFGMNLPRSGKWMKYVQYALGAVIVWFGWTYIEKALAIYNFSTQEINLIGWGALLLLISVYFFQASEKMREERMKKSLWALFAVVGVLVLARGIVPLSSGNTGNPMQASVGTNSPEIEQKGVSTLIVCQVKYNQETMHTTQQLMNLWEEARTRFTPLLEKVQTTDLPKKLGDSPNSAGFLIRHIADVELLFARNVFKLADVRVSAKTVIAKKDTGEWTHLQELLDYQAYAYETLKKAIMQVGDDGWDEEIETKEFGRKSKVRALGRIVSHTTYHAGQLAIVLKYGK